MIVYVYPTFRTILMSFFYVKSVTDGIKKWSFVGFWNFGKLFTTQLFTRSLLNVFAIWVAGGVIVIAIALFFAVALHAGMRWKSFWRAAVYLPNVVPAIALATMWMQFIYSGKFGLLKTVFKFFGLQYLADIQWTSPEYIFVSMLMAYCFGCVGYYLLILLSGLEGIPMDYYEAARIEGANAWVTFRKITLPLLKNVFRTSIVIWSISAFNSFVWPQMFSSTSYVTPETVTPVVYMYQMIFGQKIAITDPRLLNAGIAASVGVIITILVIIVFVLSNLLIREDTGANRIEY